MSQRQQVVETVIRQLQRLQGLVLIEALAPFQHLLSRHCQNIAHPSGLPACLAGECRQSNLAAEPTIEHRSG